ncbi:MAG: iron-containing alcohol dehydrogenase, partial [Pseudomonadota bacterium]
MTPFVFNTTSSIVFEPGASRRLGDLVGSRLGPRLMFVTDPGLRRIGLCDPAIASLTDAGAELMIFDAVEADPSRATLEAAVEAGRSADVTGVI